MKPLFLSLSGINSYESQQDIDFTRLLQHGIFGIFGPTGSGKSTILDAITLALYGEITRYPSNMSRQFINPACDTASVMLKFETRTGVYCVHRVYKRAAVKSKDGDKEGGTKYVNKLANIRFYRINGDGTETVLADKNDTRVTKAVIDVVGMKYDDFTRSVVLPQGKFSEFLLLPSSERRNMLERIFKLEEFGEKLYGRMRARANETKNNIARLTTAIESYGGITRQSVNAMAALRAEKKAVLDALNKENGELTALTEKYRELKADYDTYTDMLEKSKRLALISEEMSEKKNRILLARKAAELMGFITEKQNTAKRLEQLEREADSLASDVEEAGKRLESARAAHDTARTEKEERLLFIAGEENKIEQAAQLQKELDEANNELGKKQREYKAIKTELDKLKAKLDGLSLQISDTDKNLTKCAERKSGIICPAEDRKLAQEGLECENNVTRLKLEQARRAERNKESAKKLDALDKYTKEKGLERKNLEEGLQVQTERILALKAQIKERDAQIAAQAAYALASNLKDGEPCPVCGSVSHPNIAGVAGGTDIDADDLNASLEVLETAFAKQRDSLHFVSVEIGKAAASREAESANHENGTAELARLESDIITFELRIQSVKDSLARFGVPTVAGICKKIAENDLLREKLESEESALRDKHKSLVAQKDSLSAEYNRLERQADEIMTAGREQRRFTDEKSRKLEALISGGNALEYAERLKSERETVAGKEAAARDLLTKTEQYSKETFERQAGNARALSVLRDACRVQGTELKEKLIEMGFRDEDEVLAAFLSGDVLRLHEKSVADYELEFNRVSTALEGLHEKLTLAEGDVLDGIPDKHSAYSGALNENRAKLIALSEEIAVLTEKLRVAEDNLSIVIKLRDELRIEEERGKYLSELVSICRNNAFLAYIAQRQLQYVAAEATIRLKKITNGRYAIEIDNSEFVIRDDFNGGIRRAPLSLSGGEIFVTSLCLALALSSKIQMRANTQLSFFFLDEGFGALDSSLLDTVINVLETLRNEHLSVGLISHVEELQSRIPARVVVKSARQGLGGTTISLEY